MKNTNLKITVALFFGAMALISCKDLIDIIPKKGGGGSGGSGDTEQCERKGTIVKEVLGNSNNPTGNYLVLDRETNEHYYPNGESGQEALKDAYSDSGTNEITYGYSDIFQCARPSVWTTPYINACITLSCVNGKEVKSDGCMGGDALTHKGKVEVLSCGVLIHSIDQTGKPTTLEPVGTKNNFNYKDGQTVMFDYSVVDVFVGTPCMQQINKPITPVDISHIVEIK